jgi:protein FRA10AC1
MSGGPRSGTQIGIHLSLLSSYARSSGAPASLRALVAERDAAQPATRTDVDELLQAFEFLPSSSTTSSSSSSSSASHGASLAKAYWESLHKEFALADLSRYAEGKVGLRWRTEAEVVGGKGQFLCGALGCDRATSLHSYETPFRYVERGVTKEALVKVRLCGPCATRMFHRRLQGKGASGGSESGGDGDGRRRRRSRSRSRSRERQSGGGGRER